MPTLEIPTRQEAKTAEVDIDISTGKGDGAKESKFKAELPRSLADAVALFGEKDVFKRFLNAHVVYLQGKERNKLNAKEKPRGRASYLESLGI